MVRRLKLSVCMLAACLLLLIGYRISGDFARLVADRLSRPVSSLLMSLTSPTPIPLAELLCVAGAVLILRALAVGIYRRARGRARFASGAPETAALAASALMLSYVLLWSAQLYAPKLEALESQSHTPGELTDYCLELVQEANALSATASNWDAPPIGVKWSRYPELMKALGMGGVYVPWTGETIVSELEPNLSLPFIAAHEAAHAQGYAREDEANYIAYQACMSGGVRSRYSGTMYAVYYAMESLHDADDAAWDLVRQRMNSTVQSDYYRLNGLRTASVPRWVQWRDQAMAAFRQVSRDTAASYGDVVNLLLAARYDA